MTVATNALLEGTVARTAFVATDGFTDVVALGRQARRELYRLCAAHPAPLTPPERRFAARERTGPDGVLEPLADLERARRRGGGAPSPRRSRSACCTAIATPTTSARSAPRCSERLGVHVSLSHEVVGTFREFERAATTEVDAALSPLLARYLRRLLDASRRRRPARPRRSCSPAAAWPRSTPPPTTPRSPCSAARPAARPRRRCSPSAAASPTCCASTWAAPPATCASSRAARVRETTAREVGGRPLALPMVDIHTVGAGGGSIGWRDPGGALRVGPAQRGRRAGTGVLRARRHRADGDRRQPRPRPPERRRAAGRRRRRSTPAPRTRPSSGWPTRSGSTSATCAEGIVRVANAEMVRALRVMTVERGIDPRRFALLAFGGAGPLHAAAIAQELGMTRILVPRASRRPQRARPGRRRPPRRRPAHRARRRRRERRGAGRRGPRRAGRRAGDRGGLGRALPRPVARAHRARRARATSCASASRRCTRSATATATPTARSSSSPSASPGACPRRRSTSARRRASGSPGRPSSRCPRRRSSCPRAGAGPPTTPARSCWSAHDRRPDRPAGHRRRAARRVRGDGRRARALGPQRQHQGAPRLLDRPLRRRRRDGHAGRAHPGAPRRHAGRGRRRARPRPRARASRGCSTIPTRAAPTCPTSRSSRPPSTTASCSASPPRRAHHADVGGRVPGSMPAGLDHAGGGGRRHRAARARRRGDRRARGADAPARAPARRPARPARRQPRRRPAPRASWPIASAWSSCARRPPPSSTTPSAARARAWRTLEDGDPHRRRPARGGRGRPRAARGRHGRRRRADARLLRLGRPARGQPQLPAGGDGERVPVRRARAHRPRHPAQRRRLPPDHRHRARGLAAQRALARRGRRRQRRDLLAGGRPRARRLRPRARARGR